jgi:hypothetical protein
MRSGWSRDDLYLMFEAGPFGTGHQHEDKLGIFLYGLGRVLLTEAGTYTYDRSKWRRYALSTAAHNTIMVDGEGQGRRGQGETYQANDPLEGNWATTEQFDWATGVYEDGYGPNRDRSVRHERTVIFMRRDYFVVLDRLLGTGDHTYSCVFHLDADDAVVDDRTLAVYTTVSGAANLALLPVAHDGLSLRVVKGQEDPVQGWIPRERHREVPTPIYEKSGPCPQLFVTLLVPFRDATAPDCTAELVDVGAPQHEALGVQVRTERSSDTILYAFDGPRAMESPDGVTASARLAFMRRPAGEPPVAAALDGELLSLH